MAGTWNETTKDNVWENGDYKIRRGNNSSGASVPSNLSDVYHCYHNDDYIAQCDSLDAAKTKCDTHASAT